MLYTLKLCTWILFYNSRRAPGQKWWLHKLGWCINLPHIVLFFYMFMCVFAAAAAEESLYKRAKTGNTRQPLSPYPPLPIHTITLPFLPFPWVGLTTHPFPIFLPQTIDFMQHSSFSAAGYGNPQARSTPWTSKTHMPIPQRRSNTEIWKHME